MKCPNCGITVPEMPEDATFEEQLCNTCYELFDDGVITGKETEED